jgi:hypothetical protein
MNQPIGGYFEIELPKKRYTFYPSALRFQSARAALYALLDHVRPQRVWLPAYICDAMLSPLLTLGIEPKFYRLTDDLGVEDSVSLQTEDLLLYVNYFGLNSTHEQALIRRFPFQQLIFDRSQAFFSASEEALACIYSPRKFFGVADGGLMLTQVIVKNEYTFLPMERGSTTHLLTRIQDSPEAGYSEFQRSEGLLLDPHPHPMSSLSHRIMCSIDFDSVRKIRNENFHFLHKHLGYLNELDLSSTVCNGPLCYPLLLRGSKLRASLIEQRIYLPTYWADARVRVPEGSIEMMMIEYCLPLPCDQRYCIEDMGRVVRSVLTALVNLPRNTSA